MKFQTLDELLSLDDIKRLGVTYTAELIFKDQSLPSLFSKKYQQKQIIEDLQEDLVNRLVSYSPLFHCVSSCLSKYPTPISVTKKKDDSFYFCHSYHELFPFLISYFAYKYKMNINDIITSQAMNDLNLLDNASDTEDSIQSVSKAKLNEQKACETIQGFFLNIFKELNQSFSKISPAKMEEAREDRKLIKFLSKNVFELITILHEPLTLPILEDIHKDRFLLSLSLQAMENLLQISEGTMPYSESILKLSMGYLDRYFTIAQYLSEKTGEPYNFSFSSFGEFNSYQYLVDEYQKYSKSHPEIVEKYHQEMDMKQIFREYLIDARTKIKKDEFVTAVKLRFELFPKGEAQEKGYGVFSRKSVVSEDIKRLLEEKHEALLEEKINFFSASDYLWTLEEAQTFNGYRGHIYPNGKVIFEKFYRATRDGLSPAYDEAIIAMDLLDFIEVAPKTKTELIDIIRSQKENIKEVTHHPQNRNIRRIYHVLGWQQKVDALITEKAMEYDFDLIETLLSEISNTKPQDFKSPYRK